ncbi:peptidoglycan-binding protein [Albidovulum sp.]
MQKAFVITVAAVLAAGRIWAQDVALVIGNENYRNASDISAAADALDAVTAAERAGLEVHAARDLSAAQMRTLLAEYYAAADPAGGAEQAPGRSLFVLSGHFVHAGGLGWILGVDADAPSLATADAAGLSLSTVLQMAQERPGGALVLMGTEDRRIRLGRGLEPGFGAMEPPQGVTVIRGDAAAVAELAREVVERPGLTPAAIAALAEDEGLTVAGYRGASGPFLPEPAAGAADTTGPAAGAGSDTAAADRAVWDASRAIGTKTAYEAYLRRYPDGLFAAEARKAIADLSDPLARARAEEEALRLTREQRRQIQRDLSILDIDPRGIDGLFGRGSRAAIATWQRRNGHEATGYITGPQMAALAAQAERRAAELEAEAAARKAEQDRQDQLYWEQTGAAGDEAGLRAYLKRYPDGLFAELAQERLDVIEAGRRDQAAAVDRAAWDSARAADTVQAYEDYLARFPKGAFIAEAQQRIDALSETAAEADARAQAERIEAQLGLNPAMRRLVEQRLAAMGLRPGPADGIFDDETRRALRRYQQTRNLSVTGYLNQQTVARLLVDSF